MIQREAGHDKSPIQERIGRGAENMRSLVTRFEQHAKATRNRAVGGSRASMMALTILLGVASGCASEQKTTPSPSAEPTTAAAGWWGQDSTHLTLDVSKFTRPSEITNTWFPLKPGLQMTFEGTVIDDEGIVIKRKMQINVTDLTKVIGGVRSMVSWDLDWSEGQVVEAELACFAQDDAGNVWLMGEYPEEYDDGDGVVTANPAWMHGEEGALAGILVPAEATVGGPSFSQGWGPAVGYSDRGRVDSVGVRNCVPLDCYDDLMVVVESSGDEVEVEQLKYYARGVGNIRAQWRGKNDKEHAILELTKIEMLDAKGLARIRASALALEQKAFKGNKMYAQTLPSEAPSTAAR